MTRILAVAAAVALVGAGGCRRSTKVAAEAEGWSVTAWGERFEIFAEVEPLVAGQPAVSHTHVTVLSDFSPLREGVVAAILRAPDRADEVFRQPVKSRDGIYAVTLKPVREGEFDLVFAVEAPSGREHVPAGRVRVGTKASPGGALEASGAAPKEEGTSFLKEQQWRTVFATEWVREGVVPATVHGPARVRPAGGGEAVLTASMDAVVSPRPWPFPGQAVSGGATVFQLTPQVSGIRSAGELEAEVTALSAEVQTARNRSERLAELLKLEAVSPAEVERADTVRKSMEARLASARRDLATVRAARSGGGGGTTVAVRAPWSSQVAEVSVAPGQAVSAGTALARLVKPSPVWLEVALTPADASQLAAAPGVQGLFLRRAGQPDPVAIPLQGVRVVSRAPEVDPRTATVKVILELPQSAAELPFGSTVEAEVALPGGHEGIAIPASALVDDGGVTIVYVQLGGESFARREVRLGARQGEKVAVEGLRVGERLVTRGGQAIRRAALLSTGAPEGHVH